MPSVPDRLRALRDEIQERLDLTGEQMKGLASYAAQRIVHPTGAWEAGKPVPSEDKQAWIIIAAFDNAPEGHEVGDQSDEYTFGECRVYVLADADILGPVRDQVVAAGDSMLAMKYRLLGNGGLIAKAMDEDSFTSALCDEFEELADMAGLGAADETWKCPGCGKDNVDTLPDDEDADEDADAQRASFCAGCGAARVEVMPS
jgi:hypothetical protein